MDFNQALNLAFSGEELTTEQYQEARKVLLDKMDSVLSRLEMMIEEQERYIDNISSSSPTKRS